MKISPRKLRAQDLSFNRHDKPIFKNLSFDLDPCELLLVEGPNGSGKSTLLRILSTLAKPCGGKILWQEESIYYHETFLDELHFVSHTNGIKLQLTVFENLQLIARLMGQKEINALNEVLNTLSLYEYKNTLTHSLSSGQKRKLGLAKLFFIPKTLWILDEPLTALDTKTQHIFLMHLENHLQNEGMAIISSHHNLTLNKQHKILRLPC